MSGRRRAQGVAALALGAALAAPAAGAVEVPYLSARVNDYAELIDDVAEARIEAALSAHEERTGNQIAVLTVASLDGEPVEEFSLRVAETWALGRAGIDDGVLFVVARDDRRMRIEVGYGLEHELTDAEAGRVLRRVVAPRFQAGDFGGGIEAGVEAILGSLDGTLELPAEAAGPRGAGGDGGARRGRALDVVVLTLLAMFALRTVTRTGLASWLALLVLTVPVGVISRALFGPRVAVWCVLAWVGLLAGAKLLLATPPGRRWLESRPAWIERGGGGRWGGGGFSGGGFSGGGFSGGGGSFGGGGASGSW